SGLSATAVDRARPRENAYKLSDRDGLYLLVKPSGARYWRMNFKLHQLQRTASFGLYPEVILAEARQRLLEARRLPSRASTRSIRLSWTRSPRL
ncbi:Arm DNA-binding domain-containing protein, partial [Novosphingobium lindaniclasticum]|uniref:Arm DNA-binding domain-containing protein n=1 Tax=Novosphingobium lindaniclasticum TaxID=1329895 RepID=UPI001F2A87DD